MTGGRQAKASRVWREISTPPILGKETVTAAKLLFQGVSLKTPFFMTAICIMANLRRNTLAIIPGLSLLISTLSVIIPAFLAIAEPTTSVHVVKYYSDGTTVMNQTTVNYSWMKDNLPVWGDGVTHYYHQGPVFVDHPDEATEQLFRWNSKEDTNVQEKDMGAVKGTNTKDLCELVGGASPGDTIRIKASDGLAKNFSYQNVYNYSSSEGPIVLTWFCAGLASYTGPYPDTGYTDGMRLVWFADNSTNPWGIHAFGNWDWHEAAEPQYWYYYYASPTEKYPTTTGLSIKYVSDIFIYSDKPMPTPSVSPTVSPTPTALPTETPTPTHTLIPTATKSPTVTAHATQTAVATATFMPTMTSTSNVTPIPTNASQMETTPTPQSPTSVIIGSTGGNATSADGNIMVVFPPGAVADDTVITMSPMYGRFGAGQTYFALSATANGTPVTALGANVTICVRYTDADVAKAGGNPDSLKLAYYDEAAGEWVELHTTVDTEQGLACTSTNHLSEWTFLKEACGASIPVWVWPVIASITIALIFLFLRIHGHIKTMKKKTAKEEA